MSSPHADILKARNYHALTYAFYVLFICLIGLLFSTSPTFYICSLSILLVALITRITIAEVRLRRYLRALKDHPIAAYLHLIEHSLKEKDAEHNDTTPQPYAASPETQARAEAHVGAFFDRWA